MVDHLEVTLSVSEAAEHFGVSDKTIRRWIKGGRIKGIPTKTPQGYEWRIRPGEIPIQVDVHPDEQVDDRMDDQVVMAALAKEVRADKEKLWEDYQRLQQQNLELAGRCGYLQARLEASEKQLLALPGPAETEEERRRAVPWWKRLLGLAPAG